MSAHVPKNIDRLRSSFIPCVQRVRDKAAQVAKAIELEKTVQAAVQAIVDNPKSAQFVLSGLLCRELSDRDATLAALTKDRKYSRIGGAINLSRRAELQDDMASEDDAIRSLRGSLKDIKRPAVGCKDKKVAFLMTCFSEDPADHDPDCASPAGQLLMRAGEQLAPSK